jgi:hypothetical protein
VNIIRTKAVELSEIPAIAYKFKRKSGGAGIKILCLDTDKTAVAEIDKRTGEAVLEKNSDFPAEVFEEALGLTVGLPYSARGKIKVSVPEDDGKEEEAAEAEPVKICMIDSDEYKALVERYSDENDKLNYTLMNKDFIQFTAKSKTVSSMVGERALTDDIALFVVKSRAAFFADKKESLSDEEAKALIETIDEINPRSAFKELKQHINKLLAKSKR